MTDDLVVAIVELTDDNRPAMFQLAMSMYLGELCKYCGGVFVTHDDLHTAVFAGYHKYGRLAHKKCWDANNPCLNHTLADVAFTLEQAAAVKAAA